MTYFGEAEPSGNWKGVRKGDALKFKQMSDAEEALRKVKKK